MAMARAFLTLFVRSFVLSLYIHVEDFCLYTDASSYFHMPTAVLNRQLLLTSSFRCTISLLFLNFNLNATPATLYLLAYYKFFVYFFAGLQ